MHTCPNCGQACYCHGDIDDHDTGEDDLCEHYYECSGEDIFDDGEDDGFGCCYPGECCMPGLHMRSECHTPADVEAQHEETPNGEVRGASPQGEASSAEGATSTVVLEGDGRNGEIA